MSRHSHEFTALYEHYGPFGRQDVHVHVCFDEDCDRVLVGKGRRCDGEPKSHRSVDGAVSSEPNP